MAVLKRMGITETIAANLDDYISVAVRLSHDISLRVALKDKMARNKHKVYRDHSCISALEVFLNCVVRKRQMQ